MSQADFDHYASRPRSKEARSAAALERIAYALEHIAFPDVDISGVPFRTGGLADMGRAEARLQPGERVITWEDLEGDE